MPAGLQVLASCCPRFFTAAVCASTAQPIPAPSAVLGRGIPQDDTDIIGPGDGLTLKFLTLNTGQPLSGPVAVPSLVDAIQKAGGVTAQAHLRAVVQEGDLVMNPILFDGDIIRLNKAEEPVIEANELASTTLAPKQISVNGVGEVERPGAVLVLAAGVPKSWRANTGRVQLIRINRNGTAPRLAFPLDLGAGASDDRNPPLLDGDTVVVFRSNYANLSHAISAVGTPLTGLANVLTLLQLVRNYDNDQNR